MELINVSKSYNRILFNNVNLSIDKGILTINGVSGSGKSTLLKIIINQVKPDSGSVILKNDFSFSYYGKDYDLLLNKTLKYNYKLVFNKEPSQEFISYLKAFNLSDKLDRKLIELSGGEKQKFYISLALSKKADIYVFDEPFNNIDNQGIETLYSIFNKFSMDHLIILSTHKELSDKLNINKEVCLNLDGSVDIKTFDNTKSQSDVFSTNLIDVDKGNMAKRTAFNFLSKNIIVFVINFVLSICLCLFYAFLTISLHENTKEESMLISLDNMPFDYHDTTIPISGLYNSEENANGKFLSYFSDNNGNYNYVFDVLEEDELLFYTNNENPIFSNNSTISMQVNSLNESIPVKRIEKNNELVINYLFDCELLKSIYDGYDLNSSVIFTSTNILGNLILNSSIEYNNEITSSNTIGFLTNYTKLYLSENSSNIKLLSTNKKGIFISPKNNAGDIVSLAYFNGNDEVNLQFEVSEKSSDQNYYVSSDIYYVLNYIRFNFLSSIYKSNHFDTLLMLSKSEIKKNISSINSINDIVVDNSNLSNYRIPAFVLFLSFFLILILFNVLSIRTLKNSLKTHQLILLLNQVKVKKLKIYIFVSNVIKDIVIFALSIPMYFLSIRFTNYRIASKYSISLEGFPFYSKQPINPYYDQITTPIKFVNFDVTFFFIIVFILFFFLLSNIYLIDTKRHK